MNKSLVTLAATAAVGLAGAAEPVVGPEIWYTINGGNFAREGITRDLEEIAKTGISGIQTMHIGNGGVMWTNLCAHPVPCMSADWAGVMAFLGDECRRLGLKLTVQNCPGWSQSGGPWVTPAHAQRDIDVGIRQVRGGGAFALPEIPAVRADPASDWQDVALLAFPTPLGELEGELKPAKVEELEGGDVRVYSFAAPVTVRTVDFTPQNVLNRDFAYQEPWVEAQVEAEVAGRWETAFRGKLPKSSWRDYVYSLNVAVDERCAKTWRVTLRHTKPFEKNPPPKLYAAARQTNWEMKTGRVLRSLMRVAEPKQNAAAWVKSGEIRVFGKGDKLELPQGRDWTVLRFGNVNAKRVNAPAPKEATGWECDKLDPAGIEEHYRGYIGYLKNGPLKGRLDGVFVDSWECFGQTWTARMPEYFRDGCGYELTRHLPALFGYVIDSPAATERFLLDWRRLLGDLITRNYYGRMAELTRRDGLRVIYQTAFGDIISGDALEYWKYADEAMCEFWSPHVGPDVGFVRSHADKPVRPCSSAAHVYGKRRVSAEAFTEWGVSWRENLRMLKGVADRHFVRGVTHLAVNNYMHGPSAAMPAPGPTKGFNGPPLSYTQPWWGAMRDFIGYLRFCEAKLEAGSPANDVLWYLGDAVDHLPDPYAPFPEGYAFDYLNFDGLVNRISWQAGRFVNPEGTAWRVLWVPDTRFMRPETRARLDALAAAGGKIVYGGLKELKAALAATAKPMVETYPKFGDAPNEDFGWIARRDGEVERYFLFAGTNGWRGFVTFRATGEATLVDPVTQRRRPWKNGGAIELKSEASCFVEFAPGVRFGKWRLTLPPESGATSPIEMASPQSWSGLEALPRSVRAFTGKGIYETTFTVPDAGDCELDLGEVETMAEVFVNDKPVAKLWCSPYRCELSGCVRPGENTLRVEVVNTWRNRVIYELGLPEAERRLWITPRPGFWPKATDDFDPSGLVGPVTVSRLLRSPVHPIHKYQYK